MAEKRDEIGTTAAGELRASRQEWQRPEFRILEAREAQSGFNNGGDFTFS